MSIEFLVGAGIILVLILLGVVFLIPSEKKGKKKRDKIQAEPSEQQKDWEHKVLRLEKHIQSLHNEILALQEKEKSAEKELTIERVKIKKLQEKLSQEREWYKKEQNTLDKQGKEYQQLRVELGKVQESFSSEHAANIRLEHKLKDLEQQKDSLNEQRRADEGEKARLKAVIENNRREMVQLKKENAELSKKQEDVQWVAKTEYDRVARLLAEKEKEVERLSREFKK